MSQSSNIPLWTFTITGVCIAIYSWQFLSSPILQQYTMNPRSILYLHEYYRVLTSSLFHGSVMHIVMNMMSFVAIGKSLEMYFGTLWIMCTILWSILLTSVIYFVVAFLMYSMLGMDGLMYSHSVGFSGVIFHLLVIQAYIHPNSSRQVFGMFNVPSTAYPWGLMVVLQMFMPNLSLLGHLSGILCGTFQVYGMLDSICLPSGEYMRSCDDRCRTELTKRTPSSVAESYVNTSLISPPSVSLQQQRDTTALRRTVSSYLGRGYQFVRRCGKKLRMVVFGHPDAPHENIRFDTGGVGTALGIAFGNTNYDGTGDASDDDNPWIGLPSIPESSAPRDSTFV